MERFELFIYLFIFFSIHVSPSHTTLKPCNRGDRASRATGLPPTMTEPPLSFVGQCYSWSFSVVCRRPYSCSLLLVGGLRFSSVHRAVEAKVHHECRGHELQSWGFIGPEMGLYSSLHIIHFLFFFYYQYGFRSEAILQLVRALWLQFSRWMV
ncbi:hypothetical protein L6164_022839 [Bauhinia variegata]|uniref:Uncharacterized protein n=1 Tax=Bauhinia variegata TaxID=167791 RepID=A0ACB9MGG1_BAUVA|nr:hypothetical protein L6164_022839 [Bauhinia variegata]